nr:AAA family ATPase [uncultured Pseudodesulfovibrio sp.]
MRIDFIELKNFRRLTSARIDFAQKTTLFVGANNSGKTSAIQALKRFLYKRGGFELNDIPLQYWQAIDEIGEAYVKDEDRAYVKEWRNVLPSLDVWLSVKKKEIYRVIHLVPSLDWTPKDKIGVRLQLEPKTKDEDKIKHNLQEDFVIEKKNASDRLKDCKDKPDGFSLWPSSLTNFLERYLNKYFTLHVYLLDPSKIENPENAVAKPQELVEGAEAILWPFQGLIQFDDIDAQRGFSDSTTGGEKEGDAGHSLGGHKNILSKQLRTYFDKHLDPETMPSEQDIQALGAIHQAQHIFDERLRECFADPLKELEELGYPGVSNPRINISSSINLQDSLNHTSAVRYDAAPPEEKGARSKHLLPEGCNGLGYQNLISMVFQLASFRDNWLQVGKAVHKDSESKGTSSPAPLHLVFVEEPEAHLHAQVQKVFIDKAYGVLRNDVALREGTTLSTQLIVSTHSSHVAHATPFDCMRYFRRTQAVEGKTVPNSEVVNLSKVFEPEDDTAQFVSRYLKATHADLFFADGAIFVEGTAERMLVPHFIQSKADLRDLSCCYVTLLEVGGSHMQRWMNLIEILGVNSLIITDLDSAELVYNEKTNKTVKKSRQPLLDHYYVTTNDFLQKILPAEELVDTLLKMDDNKNIKNYKNFSLRVAYQHKVNVALDKENSGDAYPYTFEDALALENIELFKKIQGNGLVRKFAKAVNSSLTVSELSSELYGAIKKTNGGKANFALDMLYSVEPEKLNPPSYIYGGLLWLQDKLVNKRKEVVKSEGMGKAKGKAEGEK